MRMTTKRVAMNENAKKAQAVINDLAKYKVGQVVYVSAGTSGSWPSVRTERIAKVGIDVTRMEFVYLTRWGATIDYEDRIAATLDELKAKNIAMLEESADAWKAMRGVSDSEQKRRAATSRRRIKAWRAVTEDDVEHTRN